MKRKIFISIFLTAVAVLLTASALSTAVMYTRMSEESMLEVRDVADSVASILNASQNDTEILTAFAENARSRITLIAADGRVIYDNDADETAMDNHLDRPEVVQALSSGSGEVVRNSETIGKRTFYRAVRLNDGSVLRVAATGSSFFGLLGGWLPWTLLIAALVCFAALITALTLADSLTRPINTINIEDPLSNNVYDELSPLLTRLEAQNGRIREQIRELTANKREFECITDGMQEGIVIFSAEGGVLSANRSAKQILSDHTDGSYLELCRDAVYADTVEKALRGERSVATLERAGRIYSMHASPVGSADQEPGAPSGSAVLLISDVTETAASERQRREFTANVSHELKTPLTSIMGYAELISHSMASPADVPGFGSRIYNESRRLLALIEDIIRLSQLDEGGLKEEFKEQDIGVICAEVTERLSDRAAECGVTLRFVPASEPLTVSGIKQVIYEMVYNLTDNAIRYNRAGGSAELTAQRRDGRIVLKVSDTGIGIAPEHRTRVFERFYSVDKSRSKANGGTGLGLSIVKHGAMLHDAEVSLDSVPGHGTCVTVSFPAVHKQ